MKNKSIKTEVVFYGTEPTWESEYKTEEDKDCALIRAFQWYNYMASDAEKKRWLIDYMKENSYDKVKISKISTLDRVDLVYGNTSEFSYGYDTGRYARMMSLKAPLPEKTKKDLDGVIEYLIKNVDAPVEKTEVETSQEKTQDVQTSIRKKVQNILEEIEMSVDSMISTGKELNPKSLMEKYNIKKSYSSSILKELKVIKSEYESVLKSKDEETKEAYSNCSPKNLKVCVSGLTSLEKEIETIANQVIIKKPRKSNKSPVDLVKKLVYLKEDKALGLTSLLPSKIIGAGKVLLFNVKTENLTLLECTNNHGLSVKGTTITNFDPAHSFAKKLRKPSVNLVNFKTGGYRTIKGNLVKIKGTQKVAKGRTNTDTIIIGIF